MTPHNLSPYCTEHAGLAPNDHINSIASTGRVASNDRTGHAGLAPNDYIDWIASTDRAGLASNDRKV